MSSNLHKIPLNQSDPIAVEQRGRMIAELNKIETNTAATGGGAASDLKARSDIADANTSTFLKCETTGELITNEKKIRIGKELDFTDAAGLQQVLVYGKNDANDNLHPLRMSGDFLFVEVQGFKAEGVQNNTSAANPVQLLGYDDTNTRFRTIRADANGKLQTDATVNTITGFATETTAAAAEVHLGNIDTGVDVLEACCSSDKVNVNISSGNITGFATETKLAEAEVHLGNIDAGVDELESCVDTVNNRMNVNVAAGQITGFATQTTLAEAEAHLGNIDSGVDVLEACVASNKVNVNISSGNITGFATATSQTDGNQKAQMMGNSGGSQTQVLVDATGCVVTLPKTPTRSNILISSSVISTWNSDATSDLISMNNYSAVTIYIAFANSSMSRDDPFVVSGTDDDSNFYPICILRPQNGFLRDGTNTNDFIKETIYVPFAKFRIQNKSASNQPLLNSDGAFVSFHDSAATNLNKDLEGALLVSDEIRRGDIGGFDDGAGSGFDASATSSSVDMLNYKTFAFHIQGSFGSGHSGMILQVSNDNTNFVDQREISPQTINGNAVFKEDFTHGFRYIRFKNKTDSIASITTKMFALYN